MVDGGWWMVDGGFDRLIPKPTLPKEWANVIELLRQFNGLLRHSAAGDSKGRYFGASSRAAWSVRVWFIWIFSA